MYANLCQPLLTIDKGVISEKEENHTKLNELKNQKKKYSIISLISLIFCTKEGTGFGTYGKE